MKKSLLWLMAISLIITGWLTYADNEFIVHDTTGWTITVYSQDKSYWITIQDKNLWATVVWTWTASYWYYFQWWNNHWNPWDSEAVDTLLEWNENYNEKWYDGPETRFINKNNINNDIWSDDEFHNNLRWGSWDREITDPTIMMWYDTLNHMVLNAVNRRWPCGEWYHVPSAWEWYELMMLWCSANSDICTGDVIQMGDTDSWDLWKILTGKGLWSMFSDDLFLPFQWLRYKNSYWTPGIALNWACVQYEISTPRFGILFCTKSYPSVQTIRVRGVGISDAYPIRCFKNPYVFTVTFLDDGEVVTSWSVVSGGTWDEIIPTPSEKDWYHFDYRYADGTDTEFDFTSPITGDVKLRAHWTFIAKIPNGIYTWLNWWDISVVWNDETRWDINLTIAWENLDWRYYWWWNEPADDNRDTNPTDWEEHNNDWWWGSDTFENGFSPNPVNFEERQWPCPAWYHVPSRGEWNKLVIAWCNIDTWCNAWYSDETRDWVLWDLEKLENYWSEDNKLVSISWSSKSELWERFKEQFNTPPNGRVYAARSSSPTQWNGYGAWYMRVDYYFLTPANYLDRMDGWPVRCIKNHTIPPKTFTVDLFNGNEHVWSGNVISWDKIPTEIISWYNLTWLTKEWNTFSWWAISWTDEKFDIENDIVSMWMILNAVWQINQYTITFDIDGKLTTITWDYGSPVTSPANPTKNGYTFKWWDRPVPSTMPAENMTIKAIWEKVSGWSSGWWGGGWWGWWGGSSSSCKNLPANAVANNSSTPSSNTNYYYSTNTSKVCTFQCKSGYTRNAEKETCDKVSDTQTTSWKNVKEPEGTWNNTKVETWNNTEMQTWSKIDTPEQASQDNKQDTQDSTTKTPEWKTNSTTSSTYSPEFQEAYEFAKGNWITTMPTIQKANMDGKLTRIAMAKMLSQYAINVLWKNPDATQNNKFNDVTEKMDSDYDDWVTLAYQLWIMWQNMPWNNFRPNDEVTRAEFATALSRMVYWTSDGEYKATSKYYVHHMEKLVKEWIITNDDPNMKELRWYVMIMLMRSVK